MKGLMQKHLTSLDQRKNLTLVSLTTKLVVKNMIRISISTNAMDFFKYTHALIKVVPPGKQFVSKSVGREGGISYAKD